MVNSRSKGAVGEREAAHLWKEIGFLNARRGFQFRDGSENADVVNTGMWWVEVKRVRRMHPKGWVDAYDQALKASRDAFAKQYCELLTPLVMVRENRKPWIVMVLYDDLIKSGLVLTDDEPSSGPFCKVLWKQFASAYLKRLETK